MTGADSYEAGAALKAPADVNDMGQVISLVTLGTRSRQRQAKPRGSRHENTPLPIRSYEP